MIIIFSGYNQRAIIAFLRSMKKNNIENYYIIAASINDTILKTDYANKVYYIRKKQELNKQEIFNVFHELSAKIKDSFVVVPSTEALNRFLLENRFELNKMKFIVPMVNKQLYEKISDKESFWKICKYNALDVPELISLNESFKQPYVAKPKKYYNCAGKVFSPILVFCEQEHRDFLKNYPSDDFDYQEYIEGNSYYLLFYFAQNGEVYKFSQTNYAQQIGGKSILAAAVSDIHKNNICNRYVSLFKNLKYTGFVMIELRESNGIYYMIEANPRFWGPSQLFVDAKMPFFEAFLNDYNEPIPFSLENIDYDAKYLWSGGCRQEIVNEDKCVFLGEGKRILSENWNEFVSSDIYKRNDTINIYNFEKGGNR